MGNIKSGGAIIVLLMTLLFAFIGLSLYGMEWLPNSNNHLFDMKISGVPLMVEIADEPAEYKRGLVGRRSIPKNYGMLFVFDKSAKWRVTTVGMKFPTSIFWIDKNGTIVDLVNYASISLNNIYSPRKKAQYILETNADFADIFNINIGDKAILPFVK